VLSAVRAAANLWLAASHAPDHIFDPWRDLSWRQTRPSVLSRIFELLDEAGSHSTEFDILQLPGHDQLRSGSDWKRLRALRGANLVFLAPEAAANISQAELSRFAELGINRLIFGARDNENETEEIRVQLKWPNLTPKSRSKKNGFTLNELGVSGGAA
jgi:hypothetical protein